MKNYTNQILSFCLFFSFYTFSQGLQYEIGINDSYKQEIIQIANKNEFTYALVKYAYFYVYLEKYDSLGNRLVKMPLWENQDVSWMNPSQMVITNDNNIWVIGEALFCDVPNEAQHVYVFDSNCQRINTFVHTYDITLNGYSLINAMGSISDTSVAVNFRYFDNSWIEIFTPTTQTLLANVNTPQLFGFGKNSQFHLLGHTIDKIYGIDAQGILQDSITLPSFFREIGTWNDTIIVLGYNELYKVTPDLQSYTTHPIPNLSNFTRLKIDYQGVRFISSNFNKGVHYLDHNLSLQSLTIVPVFDPNNTIFDFDQSVTVAKNFGLTIHESVRLASYSLLNAQSNSVNRSDIAVLGLDFTDYLAQNVSVGNVYKLDAKANVLIKNVGQNVVDSVRLNHYYGPNIACGDNITS